MTRVLQISDLRKDATVGVGDEFIINKQLVDGYDSRVILGGALGPGLAALSNINNLNDVSTIQPENGQALVWSGTEWVPGNVAGGSSGGTLQAVTDNGNTTSNNLLLGSGSPYKIVLNATDGSITSGPVLASFNSGTYAPVIEAKGNTSGVQTGAFYYYTDGSLRMFSGSATAGFETFKVDKDGSSHFGIGDVDPLYRVNVIPSVGVRNGINIETKNVGDSDNALLVGNNSFVLTNGGDVTSKGSASFGKGATFNAGTGAVTTIDGFGNITIPGTASITGNTSVGTTVSIDALTGNITTSGTISAGNIIGQIDTVAASAKQLETTHTLWGQNFNGTQDVSGALSSVLSITGTTSDPLVIAPGGTQEVQIGSTTTGDVEFQTSGTYNFYKSSSDAIYGSQNFNNITAAVTYTWPNKSGTVAMLSDIGGGPTTFKGVVDLTTATAPSDPQVGDLYINNTTGTVDDSWTGSAGSSCKPEDRIIWDGSAWDLVQEASVLSPWVEEGTTITPVNTQSSLVLGDNAPLNPTTLLSVDGTIELGTDVSSGHNIQLIGSTGAATFAGDLTVGYNSFAAAGDSTIGGNLQVDGNITTPLDVQALSFTAKSGETEYVTIDATAGYVSSVPVTISDTLSCTSLTSAFNDGTQQVFLSITNDDVNTASAYPARAIVVSPDSGTTDNIIFNYDGTGALKGTQVIATDPTDTSSGGITLNPGGFLTIENTDSNSNNVFEYTVGGVVFASISADGTLFAKKVEGGVDGKVDEAAFADLAENSQNCFRSVTPGVGMDPLSGGQLVQDITLNCVAADASTPGVVVLYNGVDSTDASLAATASSVNAVYEYVGTYAPAKDGTGATGTWPIAATSVATQDLAALPD